MNAFPLVADVFLKCCPVLSVKTKWSRQTILLCYFCKLCVSQVQLLSQSEYRVRLLPAALRLTSALDHEVSKPLWWRLVLLMMHKQCPTNNFHTSFVFPAMQKTCLKYQHPSTTVWLWWLNLAIALASLVIPAHHSCIVCASWWGHSHARLLCWQWVSVFVPV